jgi:hypothetical protein
MPEKTFARGLWVNVRENQPSYVICGLSINVDQFTEFCKENAVDGKIKLNALVAKSGKPYVVIDDYKAKSETNPFDTDDNPPF